MLPILLQTQLQAQFAKFDVDNSGCLDFDEFMEMYRFMSLTPAVTAIMRYNTQSPCNHKQPFRADLVSKHAIFRQAALFPPLVCLCLNSMVCLGYLRCCRGLDLEEA